MSNLNLAIVSPAAGERTETFIKQHLEGLNIDFHFFGGYLPIKLLHKEEETRLSFDLTFGNLFQVIKQLIKFKSIDGQFVRNIKFIAALRKHKIQVLLLEYGATAAECLPACKELNIPIVVFFHGYDVFMKDMIEKYKDGYLEVGRYASTIFVVSELMKNRLIAIGIPPKKLVLNPCSPHPRFLKIIPNCNDKIVLSVGRFVDKKAPYYTLFAFKLLLEVHSDAKLFFCGAGSLLDTCVNLAKLWGITDSTQFLGKVNPDTISELLKNASIYVQHSITASNGDSEGTPVAILEAMAAGLPVVSTYHSGITQVVEDGISGFLVNEHDVKKMAEKMIYLINNPKKSRTMGENGRRIIKKKYHPLDHLSLIKKAIEND